jgi:hypothetical protein
MVFLLDVNYPIGNYGLLVRVTMTEVSRKEVDPYIYIEFESQPNHFVMQTELWVSNTKEKYC